jgi:protein TonB
MKYARGWPLLLALLVGAPQAQAQVGFLPAPFAGEFSGGGFGIGVSRHGRHGHLSAFISGGSGYYSSFYGYPCYPIGVSRVSVVQVVTPPPPLVVAAQPIIVGVDRPPPRPRLEEIEPPQEKPREGGFRPVRPEERGRQPAPMPPVPPEPKPPEAPPAKPPAKEKEKPPPEEVPERPRPLRPEADPRAESARLSALGQAAFAAGEYGRAAQRFRQAVHVNPNDARAFFLLAQAEFALGKYDEAVAAIQSGMRLEPDWPTQRFRPVTLYDDNVSDLPEHLQALEDALARLPDDPVLLFLYAYQLWFDGRQEEARPLFQRAAAVAPDKSFSERFLLARPDQPVL